MKYREKLGYIALGGFLMLVGMLAAGLTSPSGAFNNAPDAVFGTITCREIKVVDAEGELGAEMRGDEYGKGGVVRVYSKDGKTGASMRIYEHGGAVSVFGGISGASMGVNEYGNGEVTTTDKNGKLATLD